ncbi:ATP-binding protein [Streptomyces uncialis]|uniref:sensor histidine kinase n=1 Tax=Streptomyces uncialis TaxID=1048205 RepID=UPI002E338C6F|nr:ATP-binding protein [Streptomyces uncialis]
MSFRVRVLALLMLVAVAATAATAWLTLRQVTRQISESTVSDRQDVVTVDRRLREHADRHGTWHGVEKVVRSLTESTGQRIRVQDETGEFTIDSDALGGRTPRPVGAAPPFLIDPRPQAGVFPGPGTVPTPLTKATLLSIVDYRASVRFAECLALAGITPSVHRDRMNVPVYRGPGGRTRAGGCALPRVTDAEHERAVAGAQDCAAVSHDLAMACASRAFALQTVDVGPQPLRASLGALDDTGLTVASRPAVLVALGVGGAAVLGALLLSRAVLRPVKDLTAASSGLAEGDLARRVPASGGDEIGELGRSFNRMADALAAGEERQRRLIGDIAHELRTPLGNLRGYLEAMQDGYVEPTPELLASLHEEAMLQQRIVDDLQDLALAEAGALTYHRTELDARDLLDACATAHRALADGAGVALAVVPHPLPVLVHGDPARLRQALSNLVGNAVRHTEAGGRVTLAVADRGTGRTARTAEAALTVRDTGSGIPADQLPYLFDRFWRADGARGRATGGSGLGLPIARQIVDDHGGRVEVSSEVGTGTVFTVTLPVPKGLTGGGT